MSPKQQASTTVRIRINGEDYDSPNPTTGAALYALGHLAESEHLLREVGADTEGRPIPNDETAVELNDGDRFHTPEHGARLYTIVINGRRKTVAEPKLSFAEIVALAFNPPPTGPNWVFTVTYRNGPAPNPQGSLADGETVCLQDGMIFNVTATDKS